ncbi:MAG TPA: hypothetical protein VG406_29665 [Isosphaeraceae bacterium]|nr:hypothetical protein [Isosphaeraceae bacterium]
MRDLRSTVRALRERGGSLSEPYCDGFHLEPPSGERWPKGLPASPLLREFYAECDGGELGSFSFLPLEELAEETESVLDWMEGNTDPGARPKAGRCVMFGHNEYSHALIWDADRDAVLIYDSDGGDIWDADETTLAYDGSGPGATGRLTLAQFFERLVNPAADAGDEVSREWAEALRLLDPRD